MNQNKPSGTDENNSRQPKGESLRLLRLPAVEALTGLKKTSIYSMRQAGSFPVPVQISARGVAWREGEILEWLATRPRK